MGMKLLVVIAIAMIVSDAAASPPVAMTFPGVGGNNTSVTAGTANAAKSNFEAAIGGADNGSSTAELSSGFRTINWDGVADVLAEPNLLPADHFNVVSPRGVVLLTPGTGVAVSASVASGVPYFSDINAAYLSNFTAFSPARVFSPIDSNIVQVYFYQPGTSAPASVRGFGAVFKDVELANVTSMRFFGLDGSDLGKYFVPVGTTGQAEFLGVLFDSSVGIGHVVITLGNAALSASTVDTASVDVAVMDDFAYAEPRRDDIFNDGF